MKKRAIIYARLSPSPRGAEAKGGNITQQVAICQDRCDSEGWDVVAIFDKDIDTSATSKKARADWRRAVAMVASGGADIIIGRQYERLYRRPQDLNELCDIAEKYDIMLVAAQGGERVDLTSAEGRMQARVRADFAAFETEQKVERQILGHQRRTAAGRPFWNTRPFGFEKNGDHRKSEAAVLEGIYHDILAGHTLWSISARMNRAGITTSKGGPWTSSKVRQVVLHPRNAGVHTYTPAKSGKYSRDALESGSEAAWDPIVSAEAYEAVVTLLGDPERRTGGDGKRKGLLSYVAVCDPCGAPMGQGWNKPRADGFRLRKYRCTGKECGTIPADWLDDYVINQIILHADEIVAAQLGDAEEIEDAIDVSALRAEEVKLKKKKAQYVEDEQDEIIDRAQMIAGTRKANERLKEIEAEITKAMTSRTTGERWRQDVEAMFDRLGENLEDRSRHDELREIIRDATTHIRVMPGRKGERHPGPHRVDIGFIGK